MGKFFSSVSSKILTLIGTSALGYSTYSFASAESVDRAGYTIVRSENDDTLHSVNHKNGKNQQEVDKRKVKKAIQECRSLVDRFMTEKSIPGLVIGVSYRGRELWVRGFGFSNVELGTKCKPESVMRIASISKPITMLLVAKLVEEGKLDLDKPISEYLTEQQFPRKKWEGKEVAITLRQLVSHLGGIRHYKHSGDGTELEQQEYYIRQKYKDVFDSLSIFKNDDLVAAPGHKFQYTTFGWTVVSAVVESVLPEGETFGNYLVNKVLKRELGMDSTFIDMNEPIIRDRVAYYFLTKKGVLTNCPSVENNYKIAGGGLLSTIPDLLKFGNVMMYSYRGGDPESQLKGFLKKETVEQMWRPVPLTNSPGRSKFNRFFNYGMGWFVIKDAELSCAACASPPFSTVAYHSGAAVGASSAILVLPDQEIVVSAFCNLQEISLADLTCEVAQRFAAKLVPKNHD
jgi:serine beta-lactamase-like protein LACTB